MPFNITIDHATTANSSTQSDISTDEEEDGIQVSPRSQGSAADSQDFSDTELHDGSGSWTNVIYPSDELHPSDSASRPRTSAHQLPPQPEVPRQEEVRRRPPRRHIPYKRPQAVPHRYRSPPPSEPAESVDSHDEWPGYAAPPHPRNYGYPSYPPYQAYVHNTQPGYFPTTPAPHPGYIPSAYAPPGKFVPPTHVPPGGFVPPAYGFIPPASSPTPAPTPAQAPTPTPVPVLVPAPSAPPPGFTTPTTAPPSLRGFHRRGTTDWEPKKGTKRTRYYVPMRAAKKILDEESGLASPGQPLPEADRRSIGIPPGSGEDAVHDQIDVLATQCIPDIEGREIISLTVEDKSDSTEHKDQRYESRWRHVRSRNLELDQLWSHVSNMAWLEADDRALVARLLKKVEKTCEKTFVHGKCLKPVTLVYSGEDPNDTSKDIGKTAMFVSLPIFWLDSLPQQSFAQNSPGHPSRPLLQTRCRLESTRRREKEQVITKSRSVQSVIHVPQIWALIINKHTVITHAPFETSLLCQSNVKTISYSEARLDEATWSIRFENLEGKAFHLPLRLCRTWFGLVKHVSNSCPPYAKTAVSHGLLQVSPCYRLDTKDGITVRADNWPAMVLEQKAEIIHLKLFMNEVPFYTQDNQVSSEDRSKPDILTTDPEVQVNENDSLHVAEVNQLMDAMSQLTHQGKTNTPAIETLASELAIRRPGKDGDPDPIHSHPSLSAKPRSTFAPPTVPQRKEESSTPPSQPQLPLSTSHSRPGKAAKTALSNSGWGTFGAKNYLERTENSEQTRKSTSQCEVYVTAHRSSCNSSSSQENKDKVCMGGTSPEDPAESQEMSGNGNDRTGTEGISNQNCCDHHQHHHQRHPGKELGACDNNDTEPVIQHTPIVRDTYLKSHVSPSGMQLVKYTTLDLMKEHKNMTPRLKKLVQIALKEIAHDVTRETQPEEEPRRVETAKIKQQPIFLWPAEHTSSDINQTSIDSQDRMQSSVEKDGETIAADMEHQSNTAHHREERRLHDILKGIHRQLLKPFRPAPSERLYAIQYDIIEEKTAPQVSLLLQKMQENAQRDTKQTDADASTAILVSQSIRTYSQRIINALVPEGCEEPVIAKYWGAVYRSLAERDCNSLRYFSNGLAALWTSICDIQTEIQSEDEAKPPRYRIPPALPAAFQYLVMFFVLASSPSHESAANEKYRCCQTSLIEAKRQLVSMIHTLDYGGRAGFEAVNSEALVGLVFSNLLSRISPNGEYDLTEIYSEYTTKLQIMVRDKASVKVYHEIKLLREEIDVIKSILKEQEDVLSDFKGIIDDVHDKASLTVEVIDRMLRSIERRIEDFEELQTQADDARSLAAQSISIKAETNSKAILVFTVTTITFLPLSFVTSYLGMNTSDLRNMVSGQTLFWAIGVPLTIVVLSLALLAAFYGSMRQQFSWIMRQEKEKTG